MLAVLVDLCLTLPFLELDRHARIVHRTTTETIPS